MSIGIWKQQTQQVKKITEGGNIISLTRAEYEALETKNPNILYVITDDEQGAQEGVYSQSETICGTWIDGKPIYRKVWIGENRTIDISDLHIQHLIKTDAAFIQGALYFMCNSISDREILTNIEKTTLNITGTGTVQMVYIEYTKTTD